MYLPNAENAVIPEEKILGYVLNAEHYDGKNKARVFESVFGINLNNANILVDKIKNAVLENEIIFEIETSFGKKYSLDFEMEYNSISAKVRTGWIIENGSNDPRLTSCYVKI